MASVSQQAILSSYSGAVAEWVGVDTSTSSGANVTSIIVDKPTGVVSGDIMRTCIIWDNNINGLVTVPSGWTVVEESLATNASWAVYGKIVGGSEPSTYTWEWTTGRKVAIANFAVRQHTGGTVVYERNDTGTASPTTEVTFPAMTLVKNNSVVVGVAMTKDTGVTFGTPAGYTLGEHSSSGDRCDVAVFYKESVAAGAVSAVSIALGVGDQDRALGAHFGFN